MDADRDAWTACSISGAGGAVRPRPGLLPEKALALP
jgi:hypothetical protein